MNLHLDGLEALEAIVRTGSFSAAAKELKKAQSAVSYAIQQLENGLGVTVFDRSGHRAELTEEGRVVLEEGRNLLASARRIESLTRQMSEGWEGRMEVVIDGILPMTPMMSVLKRMAEEDIPTQIQVKVEFLGGVQYRFEKDEADIMIVNDFEPRDTLIATPLPEVTVVLATSPGHALAQRGIELPWTRRELQSFVELSIHDSSESAKSDPTMFGGSRVFFLSDFTTKRQALLSGLGFGWVPLYLVEDDLSEGRLTEVPYERGSRYAFRPLLVYRSDRSPGRAGRRFMDLLLSEQGLEAAPL